MAFSIIELLNTTKNYSTLNESAKLDRPINTHHAHIPLGGIAGYRTLSPGGHLPWSISQRGDGEGSLCRSWPLRPLL